MRKLYLFGDLASNFEKLVKPFVEQSGGRNSSIVLMIAGGKDWEKYIGNYVEPMMNNGAGNVSIIVPEKDGFTISDNNLKIIEEATGIFVGGGSNEKYQRIYCNPFVADAIKEKYYSGVPYAGLSAGAILTATQFYEHETVHTPLSGLGVLKNIGIIPHFIENHGFQKIMLLFQNTGNGFGIGIDNSVCVKITDEKDFTVSGDGNCYLFEKENDRYKFRVFDNEGKFKIIRG